MVWIVWIVGGLLVSAIAFGVVAVTSTKLANTPRQAQFDIEEAATLVAERLPDRVAGRLSHDDVRLLVRWQLTYLRQRGVATYGGVDHEAEAAARAGATVIADQEELIDELLERARELDGEIDAIDIVCVADIVDEYLLEIGAVGPRVDIAGELDTDRPRELPERGTKDGEGVV